MFTSNTLNNWVWILKCNLQWIGIYPRGLSCRYYLSTKVGNHSIFNLFFAWLWFVTLGCTRHLSSASMLTALTGRLSMLTGEGVRLWPPVRYLPPPLFSTVNNTILSHIFSNHLGILTTLKEILFTKQNPFLYSPLKLFSGARIGDWSRELSIWLGSPLWRGRRVLPTYWSFLRHR